MKKVQIFLKEPVPEWFKLANPNSFITIKELLQLVNVSRETLVNWLNDYKITRKPISHHCKFGVIISYTYSVKEIKELLWVTELK